MRYFGVVLALLLTLTSSAIAQEFKLVSRIESLSRDAVRVLVETKISANPQSEAKAKTKRFFGEKMMEEVVELSATKAITSCSSYGLLPKAVDVERIIDITDAPRPSLAKIRLGVRIWFSCGKPE